MTKLWQFRFRGESYTSTIENEPSSPYDPFGWAHADWKELVVTDDLSILVKHYADEFYIVVLKNDP